MSKINHFLYNSYILILILVFLIGGFIQYFIGIPNTIYTVFILSYIWFLILIHTLSCRKIYISPFLICCIVIFVIVLISALFNGSNIFKYTLYMFFLLNPLSVFYLYTIIEKRNINIQPFLLKFSRFIALVQLPIIIIQKYGYEFLIRFNNSSQGINDYDFMFGSFFIKADHALGFFILSYIINVIFRVRREELEKIPWILLTYLSITIFIMESNLTKLMLIIVFLYYLFLWLYKKINFLGIFAIVLISIIVFNLSLKIHAINAQYIYFKDRYTPQQSLIAFERGYAKRPQVVVAYATRKELKWIGDGPYNYFNILTAKFKKTNHFSQLIWSYNDLGIIGLIAIIISAFFLIKSLSLKYESFVLIYGIFILYLFMTTVYFDIAMMLSLFLIKSKNKQEI